MNSESHSNNNGKQLGFLAVVSIVISSQVGSGVFMFPSTLAPFGTIGLLGWVLAVSGAISLALIFSELSSKFIKNGGPHVYVMEAFGEKAGFFTAWTYWIISWTSNSVLLVTATNYLSAIVDNLGPFQTLFIQVGAIALITSINLMGVHISGIVEVCLTFLKVTPLFILPFLFLGSFNSEYFRISDISSTDATETLSTIIKAALFAFWGFIGVECATTPAGRVKNPEKTLPRAIIMGTACVALIYLLNVISVFGVVGFEGLIDAKAPYAIALSKVFPNYLSGHIFISLLAMLICIGTLNAWTLSAGQIAQGACEDGLFPKIWGKPNKNGAPTVAILIAAFGIIPFLITAQIFGTEGLNRLVDFMVNIFLVVYFVCAIAYLKMIKKFQGTLSKRLKLYALGLFAASFCIFVIAQDAFNIAITLLIFILLGIPVYMIRKNSSN
ncbi:MAG: amino acid permease [Puniceicoccales bacterium]|jgi:APA family basic amino acid/polyamine antiporter|nr:amino acid permease [Puniceicoccales bacterium]